MKRVIPFLLMILISLNTFGFSLLLNYMLYQNKLVMKREILTSAYTTQILKISLSELENSDYQKYDDEIKLNGKMYDIIKEEKNDNDVFYYCVSDENEDHILELIKNKTNKERNSNKINHLLKNLTKVYLVSKINKDLCWSGETAFGVGKILNYNPPFFEVQIPPPNFSV